MTHQRASHARHKTQPLNGLHGTKLRAMAMERANPDARDTSRMVDNSRMVVAVSSSTILSAVAVKAQDEAALHENKAFRPDPMALPLLLPERGQYLLPHSLPLFN